MCEKPCVKVKVEPRSTFSVTSDLPYIVSILFTHVHVKPVKVYIRTQLTITQHWKSTGFMVSAKGVPDTCGWEKADRKVRMVKQKENK